MVRHYVADMNPVAKLLAELVKHVAPREFAELKQAFDAATYIPEDNGNCFLGHAIVWKMQVDPHRDESDTNLCVTFPTGSYEGGAMVLPDLKAKLR